MLSAAEPLRPYGNHSASELSIMLSHPTASELFVRLLSLSLVSWRCLTHGGWAQNAEIFTLTYGSMVRQLIADLEDIPAVNKQLDDMYAFPACLSTLAPSKDAFHPARQCCACAQALVEQSCDLRGGRGYNIGIRLIDEFLAKSKTGKCGDFRETVDRVAKVTAARSLLPPPIMQGGAQHMSGG